MRTVFSLLRVIAIIPLAILAMICLALALPAVVILLVTVVAIEYILDSTRSKP